MNQKQIGFIVLALGIILGIIIYATKVREDAYIQKIINEKGSCYLADGTCLHEDRDYTLYLLGGIISASLVILGIYLIVFDHTQHILADQQIVVTKALRDAKKNEKEKDEFKAFLAGFSEGERTVLSAIKEQEGILQSTLRYRTGMSKSTLSIMLKSLEEKDIIHRELFGKTNKVFLRKKF